MTPPQIEDIAENIVEEAPLVPVVASRIPLIMEPVVFTKIDIEDAVPIVPDVLKAYANKIMFNSPEIQSRITSDLKPSSETKILSEPKLSQPMTSSDKKLTSGISLFEKRSPSKQIRFFESPTKRKILFNKKPKHDLSMSLSSPFIVEQNY